MPQIYFSISVIRPDDLLKLDFTFINLNLNYRTVPPQLEHIDRNVETFIIIEFPPQHIAEEAFVIKEGENLVLPPIAGDRGKYLRDSETDLKVKTPASCNLAKNTRLVFKISKKIRRIEYSLKSLLDWSNYDLNVTPAAVPRPQIIVGESRIEPYLIEVNEDQVNIIYPESVRPFDPKTDKREEADIHLHSSTEPRPFETSIEAPCGLILSPNKFAGWSHSILPVSQKTARVELWHTRLGIRKPDGVEENYDYNRTVRAIWTKDYDPLVVPSFDKGTFRTSLTKRDLWELVRITADGDLTGWQDRIIQANRLMLSSLGAWLNLRYAQEVPDSSITLQEWRHVASMGRDQYVHLVYKGYLLPFGFPASLIRITERLVKNNSEGKKVAVLVQRMYIVVRQPKVSYKEVEQWYEGRTNPFKKVTVTTLVTPDLEIPDKSALKPGLGQSAFWPMVSGNDFKFHIIAEDRDGKNCEFVMPLLFIDNSMTSKPIISDIISQFRKPPPKNNRWNCDLFQQKVALASDSTFEVNHFSWGLEPAMSDKVLPLQCFPTILSADIKVPAIKQLGGAEQIVTINYEQIYKDNGFKGKNEKAEVFVKLTTPVPLTFNADKCGGIVTPNLNLIGFSRKFGPLSGSKIESLKQLTGEIVAPSFNPMDYFSGGNAKLLGGINLGEIVMNTFGDGGQNVPQIKTIPIYAAGSKSETPETIKTVLNWNPELKESEVFKLSSDPAKPTSLSVETTLITTKPPLDSNFTTTGSLTNFNLDLLGFVIIKFNNFTFRGEKGKKLILDPDVSGVEFEGPLKFVKELKEYLPISGSGFDVNVTPQGAALSSTMTIPTLGLGVMTIQNIAFSAGLNLPFSGEAARLRFSFCTREHPFILTIYGLGGGGFFGLNLGLDGIELLEASLEFGASVALDIGVASGEVHIMAGIYYKWDQIKGAILEGYLRLGGELDVLGIVSVSVEFYMALAYSSAENKVWGEASLTVQIRIAFFRKSVSLKVRREFVDPPRIFFDQYMSPSAWEEEYCAAFA